MSETPSNDSEISAEIASLPGPVLQVLAVPGIDAARFGVVIEAFGKLPTEGQVDLANRLIAARLQYIVARMWECDGETKQQGVRRKRLHEIGAVARRLLRLLHRDGLDHQPWHPAITLALPRLFQCRSDQIWDHGCGQLTAMLTDLASVGTQADKIFPRQFPTQHGGRRKEGHNPASGLVEELLKIYQSLRNQYPESGPAPAFDASLKRFVRAGLAFAVSEPPEMTASDGRRWQLAEVKFLETNLATDTRTTNDAIRSALFRLRKSSPKRR